MRVVVLGYGVEGKSAARYWQELGHEITLRDANPHTELPSSVSSQLGSTYLQDLDQFDLIVRSPSIKPSDLTAANPNLDYTKVTSVTNEFLTECPAKIIGVTGTKGKGTTSSLIAAMLTAAGHRVYLGGNIGRPALDLLADIHPDDWVVLELSSFQLIDIRRSPHVAVMLMISPDHQDWHPDMRDYLTAKQGIFKFQQPGDRAIYNACNLYSLQCGLAAPSDQMAYNAPEGAWVDGDQVRISHTPICRVVDIALAGQHNRDNVCAAVTAVWPIVQAAAPIKQAIQDFTGLEHRLEVVAEVDGVTYINDSYSSNVDPTIAALRSFEAPKVLIIGGYDKKLQFGGLAKEIAAQNLRHVIIIGETTTQIRAELNQVGYSNYSFGTGDMKAIVALAASHAEPGDVVILSPGTSSFDMFENFRQRGKQFKAAVHNLA